MTINPNVPVVNAGDYYVNGLRLEYVDLQKISISPGAARDSKNINDIILNETITLNGLTTGANGVDIDPMPNTGNFMYAVFVIGDSTGYKPTAGLFVLEQDNAIHTDPIPSLPFGYDMYRRVGWVSLGSGTLYEFFQYGNDQNRWMYYEEPITVLQSGAATTYNTINLGTFVPDRMCNLYVDIDFTPNTASNIASFTIGDGLGIPMVRYGTGVAARQRGSFIMPGGLGELNAAFSYKVVSASDSLTLAIIGYEDTLDQPV